MAGISFHNDINKVSDMMFMSKESFLMSYSYLTEDDYYETVKTILYNNFSLDERKEYIEFLLDDGHDDYAKLLGW